VLVISLLTYAYISVIFVVLNALSNLLRLSVLSSQMPFYGRKRRHIVEQILNCQYDFRGRRWKRISHQAKNFIEELLVLDPEDRLDAATALSCTWLNKRFAATTRAPDDEEESMARQAMLRYAGYTKLKKMALMVVAHKSTYEEIGILRKVFQRYDSRRDGCISFEEFSLALKESGQSTEDLRAMFEAVVSEEKEIQ
jgi:calcium-dependent protein kinase